MTTGRQITIVRWVGLAGTILLALAAQYGGIRPTLKVPSSLAGIWHAPHGPLVVCAWFGGVILLGGAWWLARNRVPSARWVAVTAGLWSLPLLWSPPLASRDVYAYSCQGALYASGHNPYVEGVAAQPCPWLSSVSPMWRHTTTPYGPLWLLLAAGLVTLGHTLLVSTLLFRATAVVGVVLTAVGVPVIARRYGMPAGRALWLALACPLVGIQLVSGAHIDALVTGLSVSGLAVIVARPRRALPLVGGGALLGLAVAVKATAVLVLPFAALAAAGESAWWTAPVSLLPLLRARRRARAGSASTPDVPASDDRGSDRIGRRDRVPPSVSHDRLPHDWPGGVRAVASALWMLGGATVAMLAVTAVSGLGFGWIRAISGTENIVAWTSPPTAVGLLISDAGRHLGLYHLNVISQTRGVAELLLAAVLVWLFGHAVRHGQPLYHAALALVAFTVLAPVFFPWYAALPLALLAATSRGRMRWFLAAGAAANILVLPNGYTWSPRRAMEELAMSVALAVLMVWAAYRLRAGSPAPAAAEPANRASGTDGGADTNAGGAGTCGIGTGGTGAGGIGGGGIGGGGVGDIGREAA